MRVSRHILADVDQVLESISTRLLRVMRSANSTGARNAKKASVQITQCSFTSNVLAVLFTGHTQF